MHEVRTSYDVVVIGAGLAGSTVATLLARDGRDVSLFEKETFPRDKLCGEFLSPESQKTLDDLGLKSRLTADAPKIRAARFTAPSGATVHAELPAPALGISRLRLDEALFEAAGSAGADAFEGHKVVDIEGSGADKRLQVRSRHDEATVHARTVVCAYGRRTTLDRVLERPFMQRQHPYVGFKRHHRARDNPRGRRTDAELGGHVEIHGFEGGYCGMSHIETGEINVCMLLEQRFVDGIERPTWPEIAAAIAAANPRLATRLDGLEPSEDGMHAVAQVPFELKTPFEDGIFYCGDAAGMIAPLTGDGQAMALESARMLADVLLELAPRPDSADIETAGGRWRRRWRMRYEPRLRLGRKLQWLLFRRVPLELGVRAIGAIPGLADALARWTRSAA